MTQRKKYSEIANKSLFIIPIIPPSNTEAVFKTFVFNFKDHHLTQQERLSVPVLHGNFTMTTSDKASLQGLCLRMKWHFVVVVLFFNWNKAFLIQYVLIMFSTSISLPIYSLSLLFLPPLFFSL